MSELVDSKELLQVPMVSPIMNATPRCLLSSPMVPEEDLTPAFLKNGVGKCYHDQGFGVIPLLVDNDNDQ